MPMSTGRARNFVANVNAMSCDLSPSSATKMTPKLTAVATRNPVTRHLPVFSRIGVHDLDPAYTTPESKVSLAREGRAAGSASASVCRPRHWELLPLAAETVSVRSGPTHTTGRDSAHISTW
ncbi:hypothetical protein GCM10009539_82330 [Cryptosporangium japonicum]|uniref:Uncharacterized protein n=1 Tax=Cryptosporangium japonicum TaxID=80872 RepID=A0ABN0V992_9ACTN